MAQLTKNEALAVMQHGQKVAHDLFTAGEYIMLDPCDPDFYLDENGYCINAEEFWRNRPNEYWQRDWRIVE